MLCNLVLDGFTKPPSARWSGRRAENLKSSQVSFAADETPELAARQKAAYLQRLGRPEAASGWHFLTGDEAEIQKLANSTGFQFKWDERQQEYAHPATLIFLSPEGKITRYLYGLEYPASDVRKALVEASEGTVGTTIDRLILYCFQYDPAAGSYVLHAQNAMKAGRPRNGDFAGHRPLCTLAPRTPPSRKRTPSCWTSSSLTIFPVVNPTTNRIVSMGDNGTLWLPERASTLAEGIDHLFYFILWASVILFVLVVAAIGVPSPSSTGVAREDHQSLTRHRKQAAGAFLDCHSYDPGAGRPLPGASRPSSRLA